MRPDDAKGPDTRPEDEAEAQAPARRAPEAPRAPEAHRLRPAGRRYYDRMMRPPRPRGHETK